MIFGGIRLAFEVLFIRFCLFTFALLTWLRRVWLNAKYLRDFLLGDDY